MKVHYTFSCHIDHFIFEKQISVLFFCPLIHTLFNSIIVLIWELSFKVLVETEL